MLLREDDLDIFKHFISDDYRKIRDIIIKMVLATDMANHNASFNVFKQLTTLISSRQAELGNQSILVQEDITPNNKVFLLGQALHVADITNPAREWKVC